MGSDPLPADARSACFCHQNCGDFHRPEQRIWLSIPGAFGDHSMYVSGVLHELPPGLQFPNICLWFPEVLPPFIQDSVITRRVVAPIPGVNWAWSANIRDLQLNTWTAELNITTATRCDQRSFTLFQTAGNLPYGPGHLTQVRWYENANDVPH